MSTHNCLVIYLKTSADALKKVRATLTTAGVRYSCVERQDIRQEHFQDREFILTVGGDGTFLRAAHFVKEQPILGVNAHPDTKEGFLLRADIRTLDEKFHLFLRGKHTITPLLRLEAVIGTRKTYPALNEIFVGNKRPYEMSHYHISIRGRTEAQKSSGIIIATPSGSHSWMKSAGGKALPVNSNSFAYHVREPYQGRLIHPKLLGGSLANKEYVKIIPENEHFIVVADSYREEWPVAACQKVVVRPSKHWLNVISFH